MECSAHAKSTHLCRCGHREVRDDAKLPRMRRDPDGKPSEVTEYSMQTPNHDRAAIGRHEQIKMTIEMESDLERRKRKMLTESQPRAAPSGNESRDQSSSIATITENQSQPSSSVQRVKRRAETRLQRDVDTRAWGSTDPKPSSGVVMNTV